MVKKALSLILVFVFMLFVIPTGFVVAAEEEIMPVATGSAKMTLSALKAKFPDGRYWNHANKPGSGNDVNNQDGHTDTPCPTNNGTIGTSSQTCNGFQPGSMQLSWQCMGFAEKLGYDFTGYNPRNNANGWQTYTSSSALNNLKPGDIVRYKTHSIFVTAVSGDTVTYADCNSDGHCKIHWDRTVTKSALAASFVHLRSAPFSLDGGNGAVSNTLTVNYNINGGNIPNSSTVTYEYTVVDSKGINMRSGPGTSYSVVTALPKGTVFTVSETKVGGDYTWGKLTYNKKTGWCVISEDWTTKKEIRITPYYTNSAGMIYKTSTSALYSSSLTSGVTYTSGLATAATFGMEMKDHSFLGWSLSKDGEVIDLTKGVKPESLVPELSGGSKTVTLYAIWRSNIQLSEIEIIGGNKKELYVLGDSFDESAVKIRLKYTNGTTKDVTSGFTVSGFDSSKLGSQTITVTYEDKKASFKLTVVEFLPGDLDDNRVVDLNDVTLLAQLAADWQVECVISRADVSGDGATNLQDVVLLAQYVAGWENIELA